ncbi:MAG: hypothetical protein JW712_04460 [Dehalococcoidales bacterium]|nr:hypothetical protein [Dehalococcoidales bacterium]
MPFSTTISCTTKQWTNIYNNLFKIAVEESGLGYECRRSTATRGNLIKGIIEDLDESYVVIADLTDRNPNVFYELGIRHSFSPRTILVAQKRVDIPSDLRGYSNHTYDWKTTRGRNQLKKTIKELLTEIDKNPERSDNPVTDFRKTTSKSQEELLPFAKGDLSYAFSEVESIVGPDSEKLNLKKVVERIKSTKNINKITRDMRGTA